MARTGNNVKKRSTESLMDDKQMETKGELLMPPKPIVNNEKTLVEPSGPSFSLDNLSLIKETVPVLKPAPSYENVPIENKPKGFENSFDATLNKDLHYLQPLEMRDPLPKTAPQAVPVQRRCYPLAASAYMPCPHHHAQYVSLCSNCHFTNASSPSQIEVYDDGTGCVMTRTCIECTRNAIEGAWTSQKPYSYNRTF